MTVIDLPPGQKAKPTDDRISISKAPSGKFEVGGALTSAGAMLALSAGALNYETADGAKAAGVAWAESRDVQTLNVEWFIA